MVINLFLFGLLLAVIEGAASFILFSRSLQANISQPNLGWAATIYDPELGWVSTPNFFAANMYGPGRHLRIDSRGFRSNRETDEVAKAQSRRRAVCSGDSFTFGFGVGNDQTWCARLAAITPCLETVNLGQGGYGIDQAYLRYRREVGRLPHELHLFAFITYDFARMRWDTFQGYGKPLLKVDEGTLRITNVPVPRRPPYVRWLSTLPGHLQGLRTFELLERVSARLLRGPTSSDISSAGRRAGRHNETWPTAETAELAKKIFEETKRLTDQRGSTLVLVYLPLPSEYAPDGQSRAWSEFLKRETKELGIPLIDIAAKYRDLAPEQSTMLFGKDRHFSVKGNEYAARLIHSALMEFPQTGAVVRDSARRCATASQ